MRTWSSGFGYYPLVQASREPITIELAITIEHVLFVVHCTRAQCIIQTLDTFTFSYSFQLHKKIIMKICIVAAFN